MMTHMRLELDIFYEEGVDLSLYDIHVIIAENLRNRGHEVEDIGSVMYHERKKILVKKGKTDAQNNSEVEDS